MKSTVHLEIAEGVDPFSTFTTKSKRTKLRAFIKMLRSLSGSGITSRGTTRPFIYVGTEQASAVVTLASVSAADTFTINGVAFTAVSGTPAANQFDISGTDTAAAASAVAAVTACVTANVAGLVEATNVLGVLTLKAKRKGLGGNAFTIATSNGTRLAITGSATRFSGGTETTLTF